MHADNEFRCILYEIIAWSIAVFAMQSVFIRHYIAAILTCFRYAQQHCWLWLCLFWPDGCGDQSFEYLSVTAMVKTTGETIHFENAMRISSSIWSTLILLHVGHEHTKLIRKSDINREIN